MQHSACTVWGHTHDDIILVVDAMDGYVHAHSSHKTMYNSTEP